MWLCPFLRRTAKRYPCQWKGESQRKRRLQRKMARQVKGSNRRNRTKRQIATLSARERDRRKDWIEKTTTDLVRRYDVICIEDLKIKNMSRSAKGTVARPGKNVRQKAGLNRSISSQAWGLFRQRLTDKSRFATTRSEVVVVNPAFTSQTCAVCGYTDKKNRQSQTVFLCQSCGHTANADVHAAVNIYAAGLAVTGRQGTSHAFEHSDPAKRQPPDLVAA
nr:transposase [Ferrimicrobium sp.]